MEMSKVATLIQRIIKKTEAQELKWEEESSNSFSTQLGTFRVSIIQISPEIDYEADPDYYFSISNTTGAKEWLDSFSDQDLIKVMPKSFDSMAGLYKDARRQAKNLDGVLDSLIKSIDDMP